jgi:hypothetical protein
MESGALLQQDVSVKQEDVDRHEAWNMAKYRVINDEETSVRRWKDG